jgi:hypothetical protein
MPTNSASFDRATFDRSCMDIFGGTRSDRVRGCWARNFEKTWFTIEALPGRMFRQALAPAKSRKAGRYARSQAHLPLTTYNRGSCSTFIKCCLRLSAYFSGAMGLASPCRCVSTLCPFLQSDLRDRYLNNKNRANDTGKFLGLQKRALTRQVS